MSRHFTELAVDSLLQKIIDDTNEWGVRINAPIAPLLGFNNVRDCFYRGHADMPTELHPKSKEGRIALEQFNTEIGESEKKWNLTGATAVWVLHLILTGGIELAFQA
jgi:hypothetical protein